MISDQREIQRKLRVLKHADRIGAFSKTCRYFDNARGRFYRWRWKLDTISVDCHLGNVS